ncbi:hypothetical protein [Metapseudomonas otitidis]|uniref:hypothetical protein n=1 Tax=Metapseudomonas otitidis TaxID=319939 RepID=UPI0013F5AB6F|nr:hypothetical protein [Pseudomonas otitidis]
MKLKFSWLSDGAVREPGCETDVSGPQGLDLLGFLLTDGGGQPYEATIAWLKEGLSKVRAVKQGELESHNWDREGWGVEISRENSRIYSLHDDDFFCLLTTDEFEAALSSWIAFLLEG